MYGEGEGGQSYRANPVVLEDPMVIEQTYITLDMLVVINRATDPY
jgi:hypothetical protein